MDPVLRMLHLRTNFEKATLKNATFEGREYLIAPVIALMEGVVWPGNSESPEFVPFETLAKSPARWNTKPIMMNHPFEDGFALMAGQPKVLEKSRIGLIFNSRTKKKQLHMDAWLDIAKCEEMGGKALNTLERVRNLQEVEVSVGAWVELDDSEGEFEGQDFVGAWREIGPDHLAFLEEGVPGACSVEMGCGAPRVAQHRILSSGIKIIPSTTEEGVVAVPNKDTWTSKLLKMLKGTMPEDRMAVLLKASEMTDNDLHAKLSVALQATVPGFIGTIAFKLAENLVYFDTWVGNNWQYMQQQYSLAEDGTVKLIGKPVDVEMVSEFKPLESGAPAPTDPPTTAAAPCGCTDKKEPATMKTKEERVKALIASPKNVFTQAHEGFLTTCSDEQIAKLEAEDAAAAEPAKVEEPAKVVAEPAATAAPVVPAPAIAQAKPITIDDLPTELKALVENAKKIESNERARLMKVLSDSKQTVYTEAELKACSVDQLQKIASMAVAKPGSPSTLVDFSVQSIGHVPAVSEDGENVAPPKSLSVRLQEKKQPAAATK